MLELIGVWWPLSEYPRYCLSGCLSLEACRPHSGYSIEQYCNTKSILIESEGSSLWYCIIALYGGYDFVMIFTDKIVSQIVPKHHILVLYSSCISALHYT